MIVYYRISFETYDRGLILDSMKTIINNSNEIHFICWSGPFIQTYFICVSILLKLQPFGEFFFAFINI